MSTAPTLVQVGSLAPTAREDRLRIAVLLDHMNFFGGGYEAQIRESFDRCCRRRGHHLFLVYGRGLREPTPCPDHFNFIYELIGEQNVDGVIVVGSSLAAYGGVEEVARLLSRFERLPRCSLGLHLPGVPSIEVDQAATMEALVRHLIVGHGCRRLVYLSGPQNHPDAMLRLRAFRRVLAEQHVVDEPELIRIGDFSRSWAQAEMQALLAGRLNEIDAVVAANDAMALGAIEALREVGLSVPQDVLVTGFDDVQLARLGNPPLTTVAQPFDELADAALDCLLRQRLGAPVPSVRSLQPKLLRRRSCGCIAHMTGCLLPEEERSLTPLQFVDRHHERLVTQLCEYMGTGREGGELDARALVQLLHRELQEGGGILLEGLQVLVELAGKDPERHQALQSGVAVLRHELRQLANLDVERLWFDALNIVATGAGTVHARNQLDLDSYYLRVVSSWETLTRAFDYSTLKQAVLAALPEFGVATASIARFAGDDETTLVPFVTLRAGQMVDDGGSPFSVLQLFHATAFPLNQRTTVLLFPLGFENRRQGVAAFEYAPHLTGHQMLRDQLSAAIRMVELHREVVDQTKHSERIAQERLATARRMQALSVLSGGVAHDLNNALGPLAALPDVILREIQGNESVSRAVRDDLHTIKIAASRASQTIKDLLTLGRQGRTERKPRDLVRLVRQFIDDDFTRNMKAVNPHVRIVLDVRCGPSTVMAAGAQLERAVSNLVRNGIESIPSAGEVQVVLEHARLEQPQEGYETVDVGCYVVLHVIDSGEGITPADLTSVFEPFFSRKTATDSTGSGLGLSIVHSVVKEHDGYVDVMSQCGTGTRFSLYFPLLNEQPKTSEPPVLLKRVSRPARILLVDDEPVQLRTGRRVLRHLGYQVDVIDNGRGVLELIRCRTHTGQSHYDLLILDMLLGEDKDGLEVFQLVRVMRPEQRGIIVSGHASPDRIAEATRQGLRWLSKPYTAEMLANAVQRALA